jgi:hypothetical protein
MNKPLKVLFMAALVFLMSRGSQQIYAQRCGSGVHYIVRDESGLISDPKKMGFDFVRNKTTEYGGVDSVRTVWFPTLCGLRLFEVRLEIEGRVMLLQFHNIPMDLDLIVDSLPFQEGTYQIDFKDDRTLEGLELNRKGLTKGGNLLLSGRVVVSGNNWKRTITQL